MTARYDAIVIGGGPTGATAALVMARQGLRVLVLERVKHPRFHVGESLMPRVQTLLHELGLGKELAACPQVYKVGAEFSFGHQPRKTAFHFAWGLPVGGMEAFNLERAPFDTMMLRAAQAAGAEVRESVGVSRILRLEDGQVALEADGGTFEASYLVDASGQSTVVGRHLKTRRVLPRLRKVAFFGHFHQVKRKPGLPGGFAAGILCKEGWFWFIPIDEKRTSIGLVMDAEAVPRVQGVPANQMLGWAIRRCPEMAWACEGAVFPETNGATSDFSYTCQPYAGPGYYLCGDAATFVDPIFSTGVCLGMEGAKLAAEQITAILRQGARPAPLRRKYIATVKNSSGLFFQLVHAYYRHSFRELFLHGFGPLETHRAIISILAGHVFPASWSLRWRLWLLHAFIALQEFLPLVPRRTTWSLIEGREVEPERGWLARRAALAVPRPPPERSERPAVAVIGAGPAGLAAAVVLLRRGIKVQVLEAAGSVGQSWRGHYDRLRLHTVRWLSGLPGYPIPGRMGKYVSRDHFLEYLQDYVAYHQIPIQLGTRVESVQRDGAGWRLATPSGSIHVPRVVVATGANRMPRFPDWPGRASFRGQLLHASEYRSGAPFRGKDVLVVGCGNSGTEIATDLSEAGASRVRLAVRTPPNILLRDLAGVPLQATAVLMRPLPSWLADRMVRLLQWVTLGRLSLYGMPAPTRGVFTQVRRERTVPVMDVGFVAELKRGQVSVVPGVADLDGADAVLSDGSRIHPDAIVAATGYRTGLEALVGPLGILSPDGAPLATGHRTHPDAPGLYFLGYTVPISGVLREIAREAERIGRAVAGARPAALPPSVLGL